MKKSILSSLIVFVMFFNVVAMAQSTGSSNPTRAEVSKAQGQLSQRYALYMKMLEQQNKEDKAMELRAVQRQLEPTLIDKYKDYVVKGIRSLLGEEGPLYINAKEQEAAIRKELDGKLLKLHGKALTLKSSKNAKEKAMYENVNQKLFEVWASYQERTRISSDNDRISNLKMLNSSLDSVEASLSQIILGNEKARHAKNQPSKTEAKTTGQVSNRSKTSPGAIAEQERLLKINISDLLKQLELSPEQRAKPKKELKVEIQLPFDPKNEAAVKEYVKLKSESKLAIVSMNKDGNLVVLKESSTGRLFIIPKEKVETIATQSPSSLRTTHGQALLDGARGSAAHFIPEAFVFYTAVGANHVLNLMMNYENNPMALEQFVKELQDPVAWAGFYAFMVGNRYAGMMLNQALQGYLAAKTPAAKMAAGRLVGFSSMAVGSIFSGLTHDLLAIAGPCIKSIAADKTDTKKYEEAQMACTNAYMNFATRETAARYVSSMGTAVGSAIGSFVATEAFSLSTRASAETLITGQLPKWSNLLQKTLTIDRIIVGVQSTFKEQVLLKPFTAIGRFGFKVANISIFLLADQWMNPYITYGVESSMFTGPALQEARVGIENVRKSFDENQWNSITCRDLRKKALTNGLTRNIANPLLMITNLIGPTSAENKMKEACDVPKSVLTYAEESKKWREVLLQKFNVRYSAWINFITEFTSMAQMANKAQTALAEHIIRKDKIDNILAQNPLVDASIKRNAFLGRFTHLNLTEGSIISTPENIKTTLNQANRPLIYKGKPLIILIEQEQGQRAPYNPLTEDNPLNGVIESDMANDAEGYIADNELNDYRFLNSLKAAAVIESLVKVDEMKEGLFNSLGKADKEYVEARLADFSRQVDIFVTDNITDSTEKAIDVPNPNGEGTIKASATLVNAKPKDYVTQKQIILLKPLSNYAPMANALKALNDAYSFLLRRYTEEKKTTFMDENDVKTRNYEGYYSNTLMKALRVVNDVRLYIGQPKPLEKGHAFIVEKDATFKSEYKDFYDLYLSHSLVRFFREHVKGTENPTAMDFIIRQSVCGPRAGDADYISGVRRGSWAYDNLVNNHVNKVTSTANDGIDFLTKAKNLISSPMSFSYQKAYGTLQENRPITENFEVQNFWNYGTGIDFVVPRIVTGNHAELCKASYPTRPSKTFKFTYKDGKTYDSLFDFLVRNMDRNLFTRYYAADPVNFTANYWQTTVQPKIDATYAEMDKDYYQLLLKEFLPALDAESSLKTKSPEEMLAVTRKTSRTWFNDNPTTVVSSYIEELDTYLSFLEKLYVGLVENDQINFGLVPVKSFMQKDTTGNEEVDSEMEEGFNQIALELERRQLDAGFGLYENISKKSSNSLRMKLASYYSPQDQIRIKHYDTIKKLSIASFKTRISNVRSYTSALMVSYRQKGTDSKKYWAYAAAELSVIMGAFQLDDIRYHIEMLKANPAFHKPEIAQMPTSELIKNGSNRPGVKEEYDAYLKQLDQRFTTSENYILNHILTDSMLTKPKVVKKSADSDVPEYTPSFAENLNNLLEATKNGFQIKPLPVRMDRLVEPMAVKADQITGNLERKIEILAKYQDHAQTAFATTYVMFGLLEDIYSRVAVVKAASNDQFYEAIKFPEKPKQGGASPFRR